MRAAVTEAGSCFKKTILFSVDGINGAVYINGIVYGGKFMCKYKTAIKECLEAHAEHNDRDGCAALSVMIKLPRVEHEKFARRRRGYPREVCLNAIGYALQECAV